MKKKILLIGIILFGLFFGVINVFSAWPYEQNFNNLNDGDLVGQDGWGFDYGEEYSEKNWIVQSEITYEGAKALKGISNGDNVYNWRLLDETTEGIIYFAIRFSDFITWPDELFNLSLFDYRDGGEPETYYANRFWVNATEGGGLLGITGATGYEWAYFPAQPDTWYLCGMQYDCENQQGRLKVYSPISNQWIDWTDWIAFSEQVDKINHISIQFRGATTTDFYFDLITPSDPFYIPPPTPYVEIPESGVATILNYVRSVTGSGLTPYLVMIIGLPFAFLVIKKVIDLFPK